ncbi:hypothetical protein [Protofrankia symbiont of Coriaria ruscifolia]|uniref:hypothetical protein n=1 Tax=Protofrankia symbiont of Coriaria ruscifolia TaxID=1306542 RepID=UPI001A94CC4D|nr:hypothetical protein [Protofrankia symbiont of Coriaria ruscifolia]
MRDGGGGGAPSDYEHFDGPEVTVNVNDLVGYYDEMNKIQLAAAGPATMEVSALTLMIQNGLAKPAADVGVFPEGAQAARLMQQRQSDFQHFMTDVLQGIRNIGSAAAVIAEVYENGDNENAADLDDVAFVFSDPNARPPAGFRPVETWAEYQQKLAEQSGSNATALTGDERFAKADHPSGGVVVYTFGDDSKRMIASYTKTNAAGELVTVKETTIFGADDKELQKTTEESYAFGGSQVQVATVTRGDSQNGSSSTTKTVTGSDGGVTVTNTTTTTTNGKPGAAVDSKPVTIEPGDHNSDSSTAGPVEQAEQETDTSGSDQYVQAWGPGY